ncbi:uncharacterized protein At1g66480-like [Phragmites australis]|uniref:uncharacterized protein At1g66480-like n=1 Tax=Phragmites australis TaxID=29695 RepID=UPI002D76EE30|nr:uncharacterized protein At1g66480-like [Phragmites australis]
MGNSIGARRKGAKVMQLDGTSFRVKPPAFAGTVLRDHPGFQLLESEEVKLLGVRARPLGHDAQLRPGRLYFLVALPRPAVPPRRAWSGALHVGARERLESLMLTRRSTSDLSFPTSASASATAPASPLSTASEGGPVQLRMRLPKAQVEKLMSESRDGAEAAARIMQLCAANAGSGAATPERGILRTPERSPRFVPMPDWGAGTFAQTPERRPRFAATPEWGTGFMMPAGAGTAPRTPERWPTLPRTPEYASPDVKASRKEKRTRFLAPPEEIIA